ncbi:thiolase family protein [Cellvibrio sp. KY-GH-1]|uniref:thiolase family protein n=1 Tax=Cellvibrio sp. KY-GH-1 TaxID=2303332 RepID=UPI0012481C7B|nr:thiolase family protein [Cellvibrio sp. KY-GH-1]QEY16788.1 thiolase family protein [Cellvibrio sp. KY-GH-1]
MAKAVIVDSLRTGITKSFRGALRDTRPDDLAANCIDMLLARNPDIDPHHIDDCIIGCAFPEGAQGMNLGRNIAVLSRMSHRVAGTTVNRYCASGLQAVSVAATQIAAGGAQSIIAGGVESISTTLKYINTRKLYNPRIKQDAPGMYLGMDTDENTGEFIKNVFTSMGKTAEVVARKYGISRSMQDEYSLMSQQRIANAQALGLFEQEIISVNVPVMSKKLDVDGNPVIKYETVSQDECNRPNTTLKGLAELAPSFEENGSVTAGNSSQITDGAAICLLTSDQFAADMALNTLGVFHGYATSGCPPEEMGTGPIFAIEKLLRQFKLTLADIDLIEMNEAFAATTLYCQLKLGIDADKLNVNGGAISMGHPFGMTGARQVGHILRELRRRDMQLGIVSMCIGGGMGMAALVERT